MLWQELFMWDRWLASPPKVGMVHFKTLSLPGAAGQKICSMNIFELLLLPPGQLSNDFQRCPWNLCPCHLKWQRTFVDVAKNFTEATWSYRQAYLITGSSSSSAGGPQTEDVTKTDEKVQGVWIAFSRKSQINGSFSRTPTPNIC